VTSDRRRPATARGAVRRAVVDGATGRVLSQPVRSHTGMTLMVPSRGPLGTAAVGPRSPVGGGGRGHGESVGHGDRCGGSTAASCKMSWVSACMVAARSPRVMVAGSCARAPNMQLCEILAWASPKPAPK